MCIYMCIYVYMYVCMYVCVCVCGCVCRLFAVSASYSSADGIYLLLIPMPPQLPQW